jgi:choline dehydrogenase-like flavoprotein
MNQKVDKIYIVGSGPSGIAALHALLEQGHLVCMLDAGITLEAKRQSEILALAEAGDLERYRTKIKDHTLIQCPPSNFFRKLSYGSDFPYREADAFVGCEPGPQEIHSSFALGGLSNVWGAAVLPFSGEDISDWPLPTDALEPHYRAVLSFMKLAGREDSLAPHFPFFCKPVAPFDLSSEADSLLQSLKRRETMLGDDGIYAGHARTAVGSEYSANDCNGLFPELFLYGATNGATFNAADVVEDLKNHPNFEYRPGTVVTGFHEDGDGVHLSGRDTKTDEPIAFRGSRVFLACGILPTAKIVLSSLGAYDRPVLIRQSLHFYLPVIHALPPRQREAAGMNSLAEVFFAIRGSGGTERWAFLQFNRLSAFFMERIRERYGRVTGAFLAGIGRIMQSNPMLNAFICQGYLHSHLSPDIELVLTPGRGRDGENMRLAGHSHDQASKVAHDVIGRLARAVRPAGIFPISAMLDAGIPGRGNHCGGTFPMRDDPKELECDRLGRLKGLDRVHIVDSSVLPCVPATTITLGVMANAHRIGSAVRDL